MTESRRGGFTLVELMIVVLLVGIVASILISNCIDFAEKGKQAREDAIKQNAVELQNAVENFTATNDGRFPISFQDRLPGGKGVLDLVGKRVNPLDSNASAFIDLSSDPVPTSMLSGVATYEPILRSGVVVGYEILAHNLKGNPIMALHDHRP